MASTRRRASTGFDIGTEKAEKVEQLLTEVKVQEDSKPDDQIELESQPKPDVCISPEPFFIATSRPIFPEPKKHPRNVPRTSRVK